MTHATKIVPPIVIAAVLTLGVMDNMQAMQQLPYQDIDHINFNPTTGPQRTALFRIGSALNYAKNTPSLNRLNETTYESPFKGDETHEQCFKRTIEILKSGWKLSFDYTNDQGKSTLLYFTKNRSCKNVFEAKLLNILIETFKLENQVILEDGAILSLWVLKDALELCKKKTQT